MADPYYFSATPRSTGLGLLSDALFRARGLLDKASIPQAVPLIGGQPVGGLLMGKVPEEINDWSYGDMPVRINPNAGRTASYVPEIKPGRKEQVADTLMAAQIPGGKNLLGGLLGMADTGAMQKAAGLLGKVENAGVKNLPYQIDHKPMTLEGGAASLHDLSPVFGDDIYNAKNAMQFFGSGDAREREALRVMQAVRGNPDAMVTVYRGVPADVSAINPGDWVTLSEKVAKDYTEQHGTKGGRIIKMQVPASHITSWPDSLLEFGYYPK